MKQFLIIGNMNAITYKEVFPLIKNNCIWLGVHNGAKTYYKPDGNTQKFGNTCWFTNTEHGKRHLPLKTITNECVAYQKYDNYDAIEVSYTDAIPSDYDGVMGVPISFLDKYCPEQFEIVGGTANGLVPQELKLGRYKTYNNPILNEIKLYQRIFIQRRKEV